MHSKNGTNEKFKCKFTRKKNEKKLNKNTVENLFIYLVFRFYLLLFLFFFFAIIQFSMESFQLHCYQYYGLKNRLKFSFMHYTWNYGLISLPSHLCLIYAIILQFISFFLSFSVSFGIFLPFISHCTLAHKWTN